MADANTNDVLAMSVLYIFYYSGEIILVAFQTVIIMYLRRSRIVLGLGFRHVFSIFCRRAFLANQKAQNRRCLTLKDSQNGL